MATYTLTNAVHHLPSGAGVITSDEFDVGGKVASDVINLGFTPAGCLVLGAMIEVTENSGAASTISVGTAGSVNHYAAAKSLNVAAGTLINGGGAGLYATTVVTSNQTVSVTIASGTPTAGKARVHLFVVGK